MNVNSIRLRQSMAEEARAQLGTRTIAFVGLMGAGKSAIGKMVAQMMKVPFVDSDAEIERVSRMSISELFEKYGETEFRSLEARVIKRLLHEGPMVLSTGGGAFMQEQVRADISESGISIWLKADLEVLWCRVKKRTHRPLLKTENPKATLAGLLDTRYPVYAKADIVVQSRDVSKDVIAEEVLDAIRSYRPDRPADETGTTDNGN